jgi:hypothetical protein
MITRNIDPHDIVNDIQQTTWDGQLHSYLYIACTQTQQLNVMKEFSQAFADNGFFINSLYGHRLEAECMASGDIIHIYATHLSGFTEVPLCSVPLTDVFIDVNDQDLLEVMKDNYSRIAPCLRDLESSGIVNRLNNIPPGADEMIDIVHTNEERVAKIRSVFDAITYMAENHPKDPAAFGALILAAEEANGSLQAIELELTRTVSE